MDKIKYAAVTTIENSIKSFMLPALEQMDRERYDISLICNMSDEFKQTYQDSYTCHAVDIKRGLHLGATLKSIRRLYRIFKDQKYDMVEYGTENAALCASIAAKFAGVPVRIYDHWGARFVGYSGFSRFLSKMIERTAAFFSTDVRQVSPKNMELCISEHIYSRRKVAVLGLGGTVGVDFKRFDLSKKQENRAAVIKELELPEDATILGFVGRINADKGINELIEAFQEICSRFDNTYLCIVGAIDDVNPMNPDAYAWAQASDRVIFVGQVQDVPKYMSAFDMLVHPTYREGFGLVLQEAAALKVAIVTTDIIGPGEFVQDRKTGILVPPRNAQALQCALEELLGDPAQRQAYAENVYAYTKEYFERSVMVARIIEDREALLIKRGIISE